jgi:hypothetical protein
MGHEHIDMETMCLNRLNKRDKDKNSRFWECLLHR